MVCPPHGHCNISGGIWLLLFCFGWRAISRFTLKPAFAVCHKAQRPYSLSTSSVQESWLWISGFIRLSFGARSDLSDTMPMSWSSFRALHCVPFLQLDTLGWCKHRAISQQSTLIVFLLWWWLFKLFSTLHIPRACACLILSQSISQDWHVQPSTPPSRREIVRNNFFHRVLYGCPLLVLPAFGSTPSTLTRRRLNGLQHPWLFFRLSKRPGYGGILPIITVFYQNHDIFWCL